MCESVKGPVCESVRGMCVCVCVCVYVCVLPHTLSHTAAHVHTVRCKFYRHKTVCARGRLLCARELGVRGRTAMWR